MRSGPATEARRHVSKAAFGNRYKLEVAVAVHRSDGLVYARQLAQGLHSLVEPVPASNQVGAVLTSFSEAGLLLRLEGQRGRDPVHYQRLESPFWKLCEQLWTSHQVLRGETGHVAG